MSWHLFSPLLDKVSSSDRQYFTDCHLSKCYLEKCLGNFSVRILDEVYFIDIWYFTDCHLSKCYLAKCLGTFSLPFLIKFLQVTDNIWSLVFVKRLFDQMSRHFFSPLLMKFSQVTDNILLIAICQNVIWSNVSASFLSEFSMKFFHWQLIFCWLPFVKMIFGQTSRHLFFPLLDEVFSSDR